MMVGRNTDTSALQVKSSKLRDYDNTQPHLSKNMYIVSNTDSKDSALGFRLWMVTVTFPHIIQGGEKTTSLQSPTFCRLEVKKARREPLNKGYYVGLSLPIWLLMRLNHQGSESCSIYGGLICLLLLAKRWLDVSMLNLNIVGGR